MWTLLLLFCSRQESRRKRDKLPCCGLTVVASARKSSSMHIFFFFCYLELRLWALLVSASALSASLSFIAELSVPWSHFETQLWIVKECSCCMRRRLLTSAKWLLLSFQSARYSRIFISFVAELCLEFAQESEIINKYWRKIMRYFLMLFTSRAEKKRE